MNRRSWRAIGALPLLVALLVALSTLATPSQAAPAAPQNTCAGTFCATFDVGTYDGLAPTQLTTAAGQPTNLALRFTDSSAGLEATKSLWLSKVSAVLGSSSTKDMSVTAPAQLPVGSYVAGSAASAGSCAPGTDGSGYATSCPAGYGSGLVELSNPLPATTMPATFGVRSITSGAGGSLTADLSVFVPSVTVAPVSASVPVTYAPASATTGPSLAMSTQPTLTPPVGLYLDSDLSLNTVALNLNGLVTEAAIGTISPPIAFLRQSLQCTSVTSTLVAQARSSAVAATPFAQTTNGCPSAPSLVSVIPAPGNPQAFTFTMQPPTAAVTGRSASVEYLFGDGAKALGGPTATHAYPTTNPVIALVTVVDSAGARSNALQVKISGSAIRAKQQEGNLITGMLADTDTGNGVADQEVLALRCPTRNTPIAGCDQIGSAVTRADGSYRLAIPEVTRKGFVLVSHGGTATTSITQPARFGSSRYLEVLPQPDVTLQVSRKTVRPGATVRLTGRVHPGKTGKTVRLQGFIRGKWRSIGKATISSTGGYSATYRVRVPGQPKVKVRALVPGTAATLEALSQVRVIRVTRS